MILRGLGERLRRQDWIAVTIEFALVVAGVFLGIQMSNWNDQRQQRATESAYLARIAEDVRRDVEALDEIIRVSEERMALFNLILPKASGRPLPDGFDSARGRVRIEPVPPYDQRRRTSPGFTLFILTPLNDNRSAYETMINTGAIAGMNDLATLTAVQDYYAAVDRQQHFELDVERNREKFVDAERKAGLSPVKAMSVHQLTTAFASNPELLAAGQNYWLYTNRHLKLTRELQAQARGLAQMLEKVS